MIEVKNNFARSITMTTHIDTENPECPVESGPAPQIIEPGTSVIFLKPPMIGVSISFLFGDGKDAT